jgi:hypothetical protein
MGVCTEGRIVMCRCTAYVSPFSYGSLNGWMLISFATLATTLAYLLTYPLPVRISIKGSSEQVRSEEEEPDDQ